jgi:hypothetical protein
LSLRPFGSFRGNLEPTKAICPHLVDEFPHVGHSFHARLEQSELSRGAHRHQSGVVQHLEMLGHRGPGDLWELPGDLSRGALLIADEAQDLPTGSVAQRARNGVERPRRGGWRWSIHVSDILH